MRGGLVGYVGGDAVGERLEQAAADLRWHRGAVVIHRAPQVAIALAVDPAHGPEVARRADALAVAHGAPPRPLDDLLAAGGRFAALHTHGGTLRLVRDHLGLAPLFYRRDGAGTWVASEVWPLAAIGPVHPDVQALSALAAGCPFPDRTAWLEIRRVPPGSVVEVVSDGRAQVRRWWEPHRLLGRQRRPPGEVVELFRRLLTGAVEASHRGRVAVLLSGGLDSAAVALAPSRRRRQQRLLHVVFPPECGCNERDYAQACAAALDLPLEVVDGQLEPWSPEEDLAVWGSCPSVLPTGIDEAALPYLAATGIDTVLDGHDADGVLAGHAGVLAPLVLAGRWRRLADLGRRYGPGRLGRQLSNELLPARDRRGWMPSRRGDVRLDLLPLLRGGTAARVVAATRWRPPPQAWREAQLAPVLPPLADGFGDLEMLAAAHGLDIDHPFAERHLVEFLLGLPLHLKADPERSKWLLRDALADCLPETIRNRRGKATFDAVLQRRVNVGEWVERLLAGRVRLPDIDYDRLAQIAASDPRAIPAPFMVHLARAHHVVEVGHP